MSALAQHSVGFDPLRDKRYQSTRLGRDVVDFLAWMERGDSNDEFELHTRFADFHIRGEWFDASIRDDVLKWFAGRAA